jgi:hypothetical protein
MIRAGKEHIPIFTWDGTYLNRRMRRIEARVCLWPEPEGWIRRTSSGPWRSFVPPVGVWFHYLYLQYKVSMPRNLPRLECLLREQLDAFECLHNTLPEHIRHRVVRFYEGQFGILATLLRLAKTESERLLQLIDSTPALAFMIVHHRVFMPGSTLGEVASVLADKQRLILRQLRFGIPSHSTIQILRKIPSDKMSVQGLLRMRKTSFDSEIMKQLAFMPRLTPEFLRIAEDRNLWRLCSPAFLIELSLRDYLHKRVWRLLTMMVSLADKCGIPLPDKSVQDDLKLWARLADLTQTVRGIRNVVGREAWLLPPPPVPGTSDIIPITTIEGIIREGKKQHNCVANYLDDVMAGKLYIYRVLRPERATLSICRYYVDLWAIAQCMGPCNEPVHPGAYRDILAWLGHSQGVSPSCDELVAYPEMVLPEQ